MIFSAQKGRWNAKHCHHLIASSFNDHTAVRHDGPLRSVEGKNGLIYLMGAGGGGLREWDNRWEATSKMAMEARSFCNLGAGGNREARQGPTHNVRGGPEGRECPTRRQSFSSLSRRAAKLRERERERERAVRLEVKAMNISGVDERQAVHHRTARADGWTRRGKIPGQSLKLRNFASLIQAKFLYVLRSRLSPR